MLHRSATTVTHLGFVPPSLSSCFCENVCARAVISDFADRFLLLRAVARSIASPFARKTQKTLFSISIFWITFHPRLQPPSDFRELIEATSAPCLFCDRFSPFCNRSRDILIAVASSPSLLPNYLEYRRRRVCCGSLLFSARCCCRFLASLLFFSTNYKLPTTLLYCCLVHIVHTFSPVGRGSVTHHHHTYYCCCAAAARSCVLTYLSLRIASHLPSNTTKSNKI